MLEPSAWWQKDSLTRQEMQSYCLVESLATLRRFRFLPVEQVDLPLVQRILAIALSRKDFIACSYLVSEAVQAKPEIAVVFELAHFLETGAFTSFWEHLPASFTALPEFEQNIRQCP